jgi:hypothetical protein
MVAWQHPAAIRQYNYVQQCASTLTNSKQFSSPKFSIFSRTLTVVSSPLSVVVLLILLTNTTTAQHSTYSKGKLYFNWGWNRAAYTKSTLQIKGDDYNLKLHKLSANDRITLPISYHNYLQIDRITIPQTNMRLGYFIKNNLAIVLGVDHMKYVMNKDQTVKVEGEITRLGAFKKTYNGPTQLTTDFLTFEHTDGLNYINIGVEKYKSLLSNKKQNINISYSFGASAGIMLPKTNVKFLDYERTDRYHVSGFAFAAKNAVQALFFNHFIIKMEGSVGFIDMPNIILHKTGINGKGKQNFAFTQLNWEIGYQLKVSNSKKVSHKATK